MLQSFLPNLKSKTHKDQIISKELNCILEQIYKIFIRIQKYPASNQIDFTMCGIQ